VRFTVACQGPSFIVSEYECGARGCNGLTQAEVPTNRPRISEAKDRASTLFAGPPPAVRVVYVEIEGL